MTEGVFSLWSSVIKGYTGGEVGGDGRGAVGRHRKELSHSEA